MNFLYNIYFALPNFSSLGIIGKAINRFLGIILKGIFDAFVPTYLKRTAKKAGYGLNTEVRNEIFIVSLTSFPARIDEIWIAIETILRQTFKPDKIILWLASSQFPQKKLPETLLALRDRGLTIEFCEEDLRSHKKYFYCFQNYPNANIITVDDDLYYDNKLLSNLIELKQNNSGMIVTNRAHKFTFNNLKEIKPYRNWKHNVTDIVPSHMLVPTGGAGTLYPPGCLPNEVLDSNIFIDICFNADDIWLKSMALKNNTMIVTNKRYNKDFITIASSQNEKLVSQNVFRGGNDDQFKKVIKHYKLDIVKILDIN